MRPNNRRKPPLSLDPASGHWVAEIAGKVRRFGKTGDPRRGLSAEEYAAEQYRLAADDIRRGNNLGLFMHGNGQWTKKFRGRVYRLGTDYAAAREYWARFEGHFKVGAAPPVAVDDLTVSELFERFLEAKAEMHQRGDRAEKTIVSYRQILGRAVDPPRSARASSSGPWFDPHQVAASLEERDFERAIRAASKVWGPVRLNNFRGLLRSVFRWAVKARLLDREPHYGFALDKTGKRQQREIKRQKTRLWEPADLRKVIDAADPEVRAWTLLGINCGFGQTDLSELPRDVIDLDAPGSEVIDWPRHKTGIDRVCPLWPETVKALRAVLEGRSAREPEEDEARGKAFLTRNGLRLVRPMDNTDVVSTRFNRARARALGEGGGLSFYSLRHTFETIADEAKDPHAASRIMGHSLPGMKDVYNERIGLNRLKHVTNHVRAWLNQSPGLFG